MQVGFIFFELRFGQYQGSNLSVYESFHLINTLIKILLIYLADNNKVDDATISPLGIITP